jgi:hypothetical protein
MAGSMGVREIHLDPGRCHMEHISEVCGLVIRTFQTQALTGAMAVF